MRPAALFALLGSLVPVLSGCALSREPAFDPFVGWFKDYRSCRDEYAALDARVAAAGVLEAGYYRVPGYPYLRTDRTLASFAHEVHTLDEIGGWIRRMRENDQEAREFEYRNLGMTQQQAAIQRSRFLNCGRTLAGFEFFDQPASLAGLLEAAQPPDDYDSLHRVLGLYPLFKPALRSRIERQQRQLDAAYAQPLQPMTARLPLTLWAPRAEADLSLSTVSMDKTVPDELGFPGLTESHWFALAEYHAPQLWIETATDADRPAMPTLTRERMADADAAQPRVHYHVTFARFGGKPLAQINYLFWFKGSDSRPRLDGFVWRVTLDSAAQPLVYESMHTSGRDHRWYPVQALEVRARNGEAKGIPVVAPRRAPAHRATLRMQAGTHRILRVVDAGEVGGALPQPYEIDRYDDLLALPLPGGGTLSLFGPDGLVRGSAADGSDFASGIREPGALRQLGRHAITPLGRAHFDDPYLLESVFVPGTAQAAAPTPDAPG